ncbi:uncharacterized protein LOC134196923 [Corticium candelabrum]|nr:uncharacterized protein LOC134196923 [Corticium candelabrum]
MNAFVEFLFVVCCFRGLCFFVVIEFAFCLYSCGFSVWDHCSLTLPSWSSAFSPDSVVVISSSSHRPSCDFSVWDYRSLTLPSWPSASSPDSVVIISSFLRLVVHLVHVTSVSGIIAALPCPCGRVRVLQILPSSSRLPLRLVVHLVTSASGIIAALPCPRGLVRFLQILSSSSRLPLRLVVHLVTSASGIIAALPCPRGLVRLLGFCRHHLLVFFGFISSDLRILYLALESSLSYVVCKFYVVTSVGL